MPDPQDRPEVQHTHLREDDQENIDQYIGEEVADPFADTWPEESSS